MKTKKRSVALDDVLKEDLKDADFRVAYEEADLEVKLAMEVTKARETAHMTQARLAKKAGTSQQMISRIERGGQNVTVGTLGKIAKAVKSHLVIRIVPA